MDTEKNMTDTVTCAVLVIGDEILCGRTADANLSYLARRLDELGIALREARFIPDSAPMIAATVNDCRAHFDYVLTTGGIGPTHDDVTAQAVAMAFGVPVERHPEAERRLVSYYSGRGQEANAGRLRMADMPRGASLIDNPVSHAPGFLIENVFVLAGVPEIARAMFEALAPRLRRGPPLVTRTIVAWAPESAFANGLAKLQDRHELVSIGSYPFSHRGRYGARLVLRASGTDRLAAAAKEVAHLLDDLGADWKEER